MDGKVIIIDPSTVEREKIKHMLALLGSYEVQEAASAYEYELVEDQLDAPLLVVMDIALPAEEDGFHVLESLRRHVPIDTPVIIISRSSGLEHQNTALKYGVNDFIEKPYIISRLKKSIQSMLPKEKKFNYNTQGISQITLSFDDFMARELKYSNRTGSPLSLVLLTHSAVSTGKGDKQVLAADVTGAFLLSIIPKLRDILRNTDTVVSNPNGDIIILLPGTGLSQVQIVQDKINSCGIKTASEHNMIFNESYLTIPVTFPEEGDSFQALIQAAFRKLESREMLDRMSAIPAKTRQFANRRYNQFNRWF
jgi:CheY-like chemotaxis protein